MKKIVCLGIALLVLLLGGCVPSGPPDEVQGLKKEEAAQIAATAVRQYYQVNVNTDNREITLEDPKKLVDAANKPIYKGVPVHAMLKREPEAGDIFAFHAIIDPKNKEVLSVSIDAVGPDSNHQMAVVPEDDLEKSAADFVRTQKLLSPEDFELVKASPANPDDIKRYFYYTDGLHALAVGVDTGLNRVVTFSYD